MTVESKTETQAENAQDIKAQAGENTALKYMEIKVEKSRDHRRLRRSQN